MAGTDANSITAADWRLASDELAFVAELVGAEERASEVMDALRDDLAKGLIRWDCDKFTVDGDFQAYPALRTTYATSRGRAFFWHRDEHSRVSADWPRSCVAWMGSLAGFGSDGRGNSWPIFDPCASTTLTASGVRFHHGDFVDRLVARGLMSRPPAPPPSAPRPEPTPSAPIDGPPNALQGETASVPESSFPTLEMLGLKGGQQEAIWKVVSILYSKGIPEEVRPRDLRRKVEAAQKAEAKARGDKEPPKHPSPDSYERFLRAYRE